MFSKLILTLFFTQFLLYKQVPQQTNFITADILNNVYVINGKNLLQYNPEGTIQNQYSNQLLGDISSVDASNPMKILVFYSNFNQVVFLSNKLAVLSKPIELDDLEFSSVGAVCSAAKDGFWIFDSKQMQPVYISQNLDVMNKGTRITFTDSVSSDLPIVMTEHESKLYVCFPNIGIWLFDDTGKMLDFISFPKIRFCQLLSNQLIYLTDNKLYMYDLTQKKSTAVDINAEGCNYFVFLKQKLVLSNGNELFFYKNE
jgi:hypothetical protein